MTTMSCIHCEKDTDKVNWQGLCQACKGRPCIVALYLKVKTITPEREARLQQLRHRANNRQPLFD